MYDFQISTQERLYLRELAHKYLAYANLPLMEERERLWYAHNALSADRPVIVMEMQTFAEDMLPPSQCASPSGKEMEKYLLDAIVNHEQIDDDKVIPSYYTVYWKINIQPFRLDIHKEFANTGSGRRIGYAQQHPVADLKEDFHLLQPSLFAVDREYTLAWKAFIEEVLGDILPVRIKNSSLRWHAGITQKVVDLMGLENMMFAMMDYPEEMHALMRLIRDDILSFVRWQEEEGLLTLNNGNDYAGAGSYGFSNELPSAGYAETGRVGPRDLWLNLNSQESVGISPGMFGEFICPYYHDLAGEFGLVYYGCCEPVHEVWKDHISRLPHLRKVSVSPWCDESFMGEALKDSGVIYSRKPSPNYIGVQRDFDESAFREYIAKTLKAAKGCRLEFIFRDIYTVVGDTGKPGRAVKMVRELIEKLW